MIDARRRTRCSRHPRRRQGHLCGSLARRREGQTLTRASKVALRLSRSRSPRRLLGDLRLVPVVVPVEKRSEAKPSEPQRSREPAKLANRFCLP